MRRDRRRPHPDPARELELLRILDLRAGIARRAALIEQYRDDISMMHQQAREDGDSRRIGQYLAEAEVLHDRITETERAIVRAHEEIAALQAEIGPDDLAYLGVTR